MTFEQQAVAETNSQLGPRTSTFWQKNFYLRFVHVSNLTIGDDSNRNSRMIDSSPDYVSQPGKSRRVQE
jgi:hypothetical protein